MTARRDRAISRRAAGTLLIAGLIGPAVRARGAQATDERTVSEGATILSLYRRIEMEDGIWRAALSPDRRHIAAIVNYHGPMIVDVSTGQATKVPVSDFNGTVGVFWSRDSSQAAFLRTNADPLILLVRRDDITAPRLIQVPDVARHYGLGGITRAGAMFSPDNRLLYTVHGSATSARGLVIAIDLETGAVTPKVPLTPPSPPYTFVTKLPGSGAFQHLAGRDVFTVIVQTQVGLEAVASQGPAIMRVFREEAETFLVEGDLGSALPTPMQLSKDIVNGIDGSGAMRGPTRVLFSEPTGRWVVLNTGDKVRDDGPVDLSKDKQVETYDPHTHQRLSYFGGHQTLDKYGFSDMVVHGTEPWAITTTPHTSGHGFSNATVATVWDLRDGKPLQRLWLPDQSAIVFPRISPDSRTLAASAGRFFFIFDVASTR